MAQQGIRSLSMTVKLNDLRKNSIGSVSPPNSGSPKQPVEGSEGYCQLKSNWADFLPRASNLNAEQSMSYEFVYCLIFGQIHLT